MQRILLSALILIGSGIALADPLYQITDDKGNVTFTDQPPSDNQKGQAKPVEQKSLNVLESQPGQNYQRSFDNRAKQSQEQSKASWETYDDALRDAEQKLESARVAQKKGEEVKDGDMIATAGSRNGRTVMRLSDEYIARQEALKRAVSEAESRLNTVRKQKPALRRN